MAHSIIKKKVLAQALKQLIKQKPFSKISVTDICTTSEVSRKSFYYHFKDKHDLVDWIFDQECAQSVTIEKYPKFWDFFNALSTYMHENRAYYISVLQVDGAYSFRSTLTNYLIHSFHYYTRNYFIEHPEIDTPEKKHYCLHFLSATFIASIETWIVSHPSLPPEQFLELIRFDKLTSY